MRVVHWIKQFLPLTGGGEMLVYYLSKEVDKDDRISENIILTSRLPGTKKIERLSSKTYIIRIGFPINYEKFPDSIISKIILGIKTIIRDLHLAKTLLDLRLKDNDVLHIHGPMPLTLIARGLFYFGLRSEGLTEHIFFLRPWVHLAVHSRINLITHVHVDWSIYENKDMWNFSILVDSKHSKKIIAVDKNIVDRFNKLLSPKDFSKVSFISNGVDTRIFKPMSRQECRKELDLPLDRNIILFVGRFGRFRGADIFISAARLMPSVTALVIGSGPESENIIKLSKDVPNIHFLGRVENENLPLYYSASDIFVNPLKVMGVSRVQMEAMACSAVAIKSNIDPEPVIEGINGFIFKADDIIDLRNRIEKIFELDAKTVNEIRENARKTITDNYDYTKLAHSVISLYHGE